MPLSGLSPWPYVVLLLELLTSFWILFLFYQGRGSNHGQCHTLRGGTLGPSCLGLFLQRKSFGLRKESHSPEVAGLSTRAEQKPGIGTCRPGREGCVHSEGGSGLTSVGQGLALCLLLGGPRMEKSCGSHIYVYVCFEHKTR